MQRCVEIHTHVRWGTQGTATDQPPTYGFSHTHSHNKAPTHTHASLFTLVLTHTSVHTLPDTCHTCGRGAHRTGAEADTHSQAGGFAGDPGKVPETELPRTLLGNSQIAGRSRIQTPAHHFWVQVPALTLSSHATHTDISDRLGDAWGPPQPPPSTTHPQHTHLLRSCTGQTRKLRLGTQLGPRWLV